jgi:hypothetical protein
MSRSARRHSRLNTGLPMPSAYDAFILADSPVMYLPLGGGSNSSPDYTGHAHTGIPHNSPTQTTFLNGDPATAFDGVNQYIEVANHVDLSISTTGMMTIEAWIRPDVLEFTHEQGDDYVYWMGKNSPGNSEYVGRMYSFSTPTLTPSRSNRISGYANNLSGGLGAGSYFQDTVTAGQWIHVTIVYNTVNTNSDYPTGYVAIYKNGVYRMKQPLSGYNIVPGHGSAPFRLGTATLASFFQGAIAKVAVYNYELSVVTIHNHYRLIVPPVTGSVGFGKHVGSASTTGSGTTLSISVPVGGVSAGSTLLVSAAHMYTVGAPTVADSRGNTYTRDRTAIDGANTVRSSIFSAQINSALLAGDTIQLTTSASVAAKAFSVDAFNQIIFSIPLDTSNGRSGTGTTPGTTNQITTTNADDLIYGFTAVNGPTSEVYNEDPADYNSLTRVGTNSGVPGTDVTVNSAYKSVLEVGNYKYQPTLGTSEIWLSIIAAYKAGQPIIVPPAVGTAQYIGFAGSATSKVSGTTLTITIGTDGVPLGHTLIVRAAGDYLASAPTVADSRGNTYTRDRTGADAGTIIRASIYSAPIATALQSGDTITVTWASSVNTRAAVVDEFATILTSSPVDVANGTSGSSATPTANATTTNADDMLVSFAAVAGDVSDSFTPDTIHQWTDMARTGTTGGAFGDNRTINSAYRAVGATGTYSCTPILATSSTWVSGIVGYKAGPSTIVPPPVGSATFVKHIGNSSTKAAGTTLTLTVPSGGVPSGHTVIVKTLSDYLTSAPIITDSRGNTYTRDRTGADAVNTIRGAVFSCAVTTPLQVGDTITITFASSISVKAASADEFSAVLNPIVVDVYNSRTGISTSPLVSSTTTNADDLLIGMAGVAGDVSDVFTNDAANIWTALTRVGTTGDAFTGNRTLNSAYRSAASAETHSYQPTLATSSTWVAIFVAYRAGV